MVVDNYEWFNQVRKGLNLEPPTKDDLNAALSLVPSLSGSASPEDVVKFFEDDFEWFAAASHAIQRLKSEDWGSYTTIPFLMVYCVVKRPSLLKNGSFFLSDELDIVFGACGYAPPG